MVNPRGIAGARKKKNKKKKIKKTTEHLLQSCPTYEPLRKGIWPDHTPVACKLYGSLRDLRCTATFIEETGVPI